MQVTSTPAAAPIPPAKPAGQVSALRSTAADSLRAAGEGFNAATDSLAIAADKGAIYPVESAFALGTAIKKAATKAPPIVQKGAGYLALGIGFLTALQGMIISGALRAPGALVNDVTHGLADKIDGKLTNVANTQAMDGVYGITPKK